jgi:hypothetical protein
MDGHPLFAGGIVHKSGFDRLATLGMDIANDHSAYDVTH